MTSPAPADLPGADASKASWRDWAQNRRHSIDWSVVSNAIVANLAAWEPLHNAGTVLIYLPLAEEVNLEPLRQGALGCRWLTTRTPPLGEVLTIHDADGPLEVHPFGFLQPHRSAPEVHPFDVDIFLVPGLAFDLWGNRLGRGAGYYDRLLSIVRVDVPLVGIVPSDLVVDRLPSEVYDVAMSHLATDEGVVETARS